MSKSFFHSIENDAVLERTNNKKKSLKQDMKTPYTLADVIGKHNWNFISRRLVWEEKKHQDWTHVYCMSEAKEKGRVEE